MGTERQDKEFKIQAVKLAKEIGLNATAKELGIPKGTIGTWLRRGTSRRARCRRTITSGK